MHPPFLVIFVLRLSDGHRTCGVPAAPQRPSDKQIRHIRHSRPRPARPSAVMSSLAGGGAARGRRVRTRARRRRRGPSPQRGTRPGCRCCRAPWQRPARRLPTAYGRRCGCCRWWSARQGEGYGKGNEAHEKRKWAGVHEALRPETRGAGGGGFLGRGSFTCALRQRCVPPSPSRSMASKSELTRCKQTMSPRRRGCSSATTTTSALGNVLTTWPRRT